MYRCWYTSLRAFANLNSKFTYHSNTALVFDQLFGIQHQSIQHAFKYVITSAEKKGSYAFLHRNTSSKIRKSTPNKRYFRIAQLKNLKKNIQSCVKKFISSVPIVFFLNVTKLLAFLGVTNEGGFSCEKGRLSRRVAFLLDRCSSLHNLPAEPDNRVNNYVPVLLGVI